MYLNRDFNIKGRRRLFTLNSQFYLFFILFDMKLVSLTMKYFRFLQSKLLVVRCKISHVLTSCIHKYLVANNKDLIFTSFYIWYILSRLTKVRTILCNNVKKVDSRDLRSRFITFINIHLMKLKLYDVILMCMVCI
jgi:hypothetical protein